MRLNTDEEIEALTPEELKNKLEFIGEPYTDDAYNKLKQLQ